MLTPKQVKLIQDTWRSIGPIDKMVSQIFYDRLFAIDPSTRPLFEGIDMVEQHDRFMETFDLVVSNADDLDSMIPLLERLGRRHLGYGVQDHQYASVRSAVLWTLERSFGTAFNSQAREAWTLVYDFMADVMRRAAAATDKTSKKDLSA